MAKPPGLDKDVLRAAQPRLWARAVVAEACALHPELREALAILYAQQRDIGAEGEGIAARAVAADAGRKGGRPRLGVWSLVEQIDATRPEHVQTGRHRAQYVRRQLDAMGKGPEPSESSIRRNLRL